MDLGTEETFLKRIINELKYFGDHSSLHGVGHVFSTSYMPYFKRLFWFVVLVCCCFGAGSILLAALKIYSSGAVSYSVETNYLSWDTEFPAVTLCEQINNERVKAILLRHRVPKSLHLFFQDISFWHKKYCKTCGKCKINETCIEDFLELVEDVRLDCPSLLTDCWWNDQKFPCCNKFSPVSTEYGTCFSFNSRQGQDPNILVVNRRIGLPSLVFTAKELVSIRIHPTDELVSVGSENVLGKTTTLAVGTDFEVILKAEQTISDASTYSLPPSVRGCLFSSERPDFSTDWPFPQYTYSACAWYCRALAQVQLCNCTHFFSPKLGDYPTCNIQGMACLNSYAQDTKKSVLLENLDCPTKCPMGCDEILYKVVNIYSNRTLTAENTLPPELKARGTRGRLRLLLLPTLRVLRHAIRDTLGLVVDIGGVGGVFFGASLLSVIEIIYLLCIRRNR